MTDLLLSLALITACGLFGQGLGRRNGFQIVLSGLCVGSLMVAMYWPGGLL